MSRFPLVQFENAALQIIDGDRGVNYPQKSEFVKSGHCAFLNTGNVTKSGFDFSETDFISKEKDVRLRKGKATRNDIVLTTRGTVGNVAFYGESIPFQNIRINSGMVLLRANPKDIAPYYLYCFLRSDVFKKQVFSNGSGSAQPQLPIGALKNIAFPLPGIEAQKKIAAVLSALDAKIDCNNRINTELEAMAKILYDFWFVQFDFPFDFASGKPAQNGKPYKSSGGKMVYNPTLKREIPAGWKAGIAADLFDFNPGLALPVNKEASYIDMNSLPVTGFMTNPPELKRFAGGMKFQNGDVVVARITPCLENGKTALISLMRDGEVGFGSTEFIVIRGKESSLSAFAAQLSRSASFRQFAISNMTGTSGRKRIDAGTLETFSLPLPPKELLLQYEKTAASLLKRMTNNAQENQHLTQLRDWLLPMLMNGQVTVE
ncbi:restriction endonuclease subunit S [Desulfuromonas sp. KJ2020]|uniref:restriction endonuclease subunit S n=1 Tax=Desulfuromonas sp. KJ2020 TaxID=2919173 RepID=UPI0020A80BCB|nr:restriction endonuclease subunit S [Desulfuromonas sp. KJ2020]MCP3176948.1 restriction endonuclease subunit S [Desulfuromonas sp. KJ2020]